jgi:tRNA threonylcarbamoyl adenosine modification protein YeaZ
VTTADPLILALDGSTSVCGAALLQAGGWEVAARRREKDGRGQARVLLRLVDEMLREIDADAGDLGAIVAGTGPGTFTGMRIAVATARALGLALSVPVLGVSTLGALAAGAAAAQADVLVPVVDARRGQVFYGLYERGRDPAGKGAAWRRSEGFAVCDRESLGRLLGGPPARRALVVAEERDLAGGLPPDVAFDPMEVEAEHLVVGQELLVEPGAMPQGDRLAPWLTERLRGLRSGLGASCVGLEGSGRPVAGSPGTPESVRPIYVRPPDADIHITKMKDPWADGS